MESSRERRRVRSWVGRERRCPDAEQVKIVIPTSFEVAKETYITVPPITF